MIDGVRRSGVHGLWNFRSKKGAALMESDGMGGFVEIK